MLEGMRMLEGIDARTKMVMDVDQVGRENLKSLVFHIVDHKTEKHYEHYHQPRPVDIVDTV